MHRVCPSPLMGVPAGQQQIPWEWPSACGKRLSAGSLSSVCRSEKVLTSPLLWKLFLPAGNLG